MLEQVPQRQVRGYAHGVAGHERLGLAPYGPQRGAVATHLVAVLYVVVDQRKVVDQLQGGGGGDGAGRMTASGLAGEQAEGRTQHLSHRGVDRFALRVAPAHRIPEHLICAAAVGVQASAQGVVYLRRKPREGTGKTLGRSGCLGSWICQR